MALTRLSVVSVCSLRAGMRLTSRPGYREVCKGAQRGQSSEKAELCGARNEDYYDLRKK